MSREERIKQQIQALAEMRDMMLNSENWENMTRLIDACVAGGMALQVSLDDGKYVSMRKIEEIKKDIEIEIRDCQLPQGHDAWWNGRKDGLKDALEIIDKYIGKDGDYI